MAPVTAGAGLLFLPLWAAFSSVSPALPGPVWAVNVTDAGRESPDYESLSSGWPEGAVPLCQGGEHFFRDFLKCDASLDYCYEFRERSCVGFENWACAHTLNKRVSWPGARTNVLIKNVGLGNTRCCAGRHQSPIDIPSREARCIRGMRSPNYVNPEQLVAGTSKNKGYHPAFYANDTYFQTPPLLLGGVPFTCTVPGSDHYVFHSLHVHSSYLDTYRSDHAVDGRHYDGEMHLVHVRQDFWHKGKSDKRCASQTPLGLVVLAVFLSITEGQPNLEFNRLINPLILTIIRDTHVKCPFEEMCGESRNSYRYGLFNSSNNDLCRHVPVSDVGAGLSQRGRRGVSDSPGQDKPTRPEHSSIAKGKSKRAKRDLSSHSPRKTPADDEEDDDSDQASAGPAAVPLADESYEEYSEVPVREEVEEVVEELLSVEVEEDYEEEEDDFETASKGKTGRGIWPPRTPPGRAQNNRAQEVAWKGKAGAAPGPAPGGSGSGKKPTSPEAAARKVVCFCQQARQQERAMPWAGRGETVQCRIKYNRGRPMMEDMPSELHPANLLPAPSPTPPEPYDPNSTPLVIRPGLMLPQERDYFQYFGSLTTPPCSEVVNWIVFREPIRITQEQMNYLHRLESRRANHLVSDFGDVRPTQPINGRTILTNAC